MKKRSILSALVLALTLTACSTNGDYSRDSSDGSASSFPQSEPQSTSEPFSSSEETPASSTTSAPQSSWENPVLTPQLTSDYDGEFFGNDLFIGDSIFTGLYLYSYIDRENVAAVGGYTPYRALHSPFDEDFYAGSAADYAKEKQPRHIIIMLGSNGLTPQTDLEDYGNDYRELLNALKANCPDSEICVVSVPPITANSSMASYSGITNALIDELNDVISALCSEVEVAYCDLNTVLKDDRGYFNEEYVYDDGMHFVGKTYPVLLSRAQKTLEAAYPESIERPSELAQKTSALMAAAELPTMTEAARGVLNVFYGIDEADVADFSAYLCGSGAFPDEFGIFAAVDGEAAKRIANALNERIEHQRKVFKDYTPDEMYKFDDCFVEINGSVVSYAVCADNSAARDILV
ncbi:MAG: DUF4358 domain-containing protein [Lachnospiraceae bacterium]|nr:DUF4358 domain-containing protein [Ruminococcus sp.]MCM1275575.1 DUF4358 domain-containing protein [Lachnospiraceae bacterium]